MPNTKPDTRQKQLSTWVSQTLTDDSQDIQLVPVGGDAGFRRYFRFQSPSHWLAVDAPPQTEDTHQFVALANFLANQGVRTPHILAADEQLGFLLVEDFGDELLHKHLRPHSVDQYYNTAFDCLQSLQACPDNTDLIPRYDQTMLRRELQIFSDWFVGALLGYTLNAPEQALLHNTFERLEQSALEQPQSLVHRDFHSRNLILRTDGSLGVIDFQGALWGACTYDLVSLLRDCYIRWPAERVTHWALTYRHRSIDAGLLHQDVNEITFLRWFDWMGLQRHIKVLGIFARLSLRDHKHHYLKDLPLVIRYTLEVANSYPQLKPFGDWFSTKLLPLIQAQHWYSDHIHAGDAPCVQP